MIGTLPITCTLTFTDPNSPSAGVLVERTVASDPSCDNWKTLTTLAAGITSYEDDTLTFGGSYRYRVTAPPVQSTIYTPAKPAEISISTAGQPNHVSIGGWVGDGSGNANQAVVNVVRNGQF